MGVTRKCAARLTVTVRVVATTRIRQIDSVSMVRGVRGGASLRRVTTK